MSFKEDFGNNVAVIGASSSEGRYSNKAVRAFLKEGYKVFPVHPIEEKVEDLDVYNTINDIPEDIDFVSLYVNPGLTLSVDLPGQIKEKGVKAVILNPGTESDDVEKRFEELGIKVVKVCSITELGYNPADM